MPRERKRKSRSTRALHVVNGSNRALRSAAWAAGRMMPIAGQGQVGTPPQEAIVRALLISLSVAMVLVCLLVLAGLRQGAIELRGGQRGRRRKELPFHVLKCRRRQLLPGAEGRVKDAVAVQPLEYRARGSGHCGVEARHAEAAFVADLFAFGLAEAGIDQHQRHEHHPVKVVAARTNHQHRAREAHRHQEPTPGIDALAHPARGDDGAPPGNWYPNTSHGCATCSGLAAIHALAAGTSSSVLLTISSTRPSS